MGTRGLFGYRKNKQDKLSYNQYDSYPDGLGNVMLEYIKNHSNEKMNEVCDDIKIFDNDKYIKEFTEEEFEKYKNILNENGIKKIEDAKPYETLNGIYESLIKFGNLDFYDNKEADERLMYCDNDFIQDSLMCEWAYIINLDTNKLEVWKGFQKKPQQDNRYGCKKINKYYPCTLIAEIPFDDLRKKHIDDINDFLSFEEED